jgi:hypothetical protein
VDGRADGGTALLQEGQDLNFLVSRISPGNDLSF